MPHLDDDDGEVQSSPGESVDEDASGSEDERAAKTMSRKKKRQKTGNGSFDQSSFSCMKGGTGKTLEANPNSRTIELLQELADYYDRVKDNWRCYSYRKAIGTLKRQTEKISNYEEAIALDTIGERLAKKIEEIVQTDCLQRLENALLDPSDSLLQIFMKVYGAGISQAEKWVKAGYKSLDDLITHDALTTNQRIGVDHYDDFNSRIPRDEVTALGKIVQDMAATIDPEVEIIIGGSYRRGAATSGDIDCLITKPNTTSSNDLLRFLHTLVTNLTTSSFLVAALAVPGSRSESGSKWHGACVLPKTASDSPQIWRRIDFLLVPATEFGAALIYFTGNDIFNRSLRLLASTKKMRLNQRGLYKDVMTGPGRVKLTEGTLVEGADEKRIFEILGVPWREPEHRIP
jgi:DNA polymerase IV